jgi:hypothetical protein
MRFLLSSLPTFRFWFKFLLPRPRTHRFLIKFLSPSLPIRRLERLLTRPGRLDRKRNLAKTFRLVHLVRRRIRVRLRNLRESGRARTSSTVRRKVRAFLNLARVFNLLSRKACRL